MEESHYGPHKRRTLHDYVGIILKRRWAALAVLITVVTTTALYNFTATPLYKATVQLLIEREIPKFFDPREGAPGVDLRSEEFYLTQYKLLEGKALARKVAEKLQLQNHPDYAPLFQKLPPGMDETFKQKAEERMVGAVVEAVEVSPIRNSRLVNVSFTNADPRFAALAVNTLARCYIEQSLELRFAASQEAAGWLQQKLTESRQKLEESEAKLNRYKREQNIVTMEDRESITAQKLEQLNKDLITAQTHRMETETRHREVTRGKTIPQVLNNALIQTLKAQEAKIIAEHSELARKYGEKHPRMIQLTNELNATRAKVNKEMNDVVQAIKSEYHMAQAQEENLKRALDAQKSATQDLSDRGIEYRVLLRDVETNRALYENTLKSLKTTTATENLPATNIRIVYPAAAPEVPVKPRKARNLALAGVFGLLLSIGLAVGLDRLDTTLKTPEEVENWLDIPNLALIPYLDIPEVAGPDEVPALVVNHGGQPLAAEAYRVLRTSILFSTPGHSPRVLLLTSSLPLDGKSLTSANLAAAMAKSEPPILLVDADLRRPTLHKLFQVPPEPGLSNFLVGEVDFLPVVETVAPNLFLVPAGRIPPNPSELLGSERMQEFLTLAQGRFNRVILDSPPLLSVTDAVILSTRAEGVILVVKAEAVPRKVAREARDRLLEVKAHLLGAVLNAVPMQRDDYHYHYYYRYAYYSHYAQADGAEAGKRRTRRKAPRLERLIAGLKDRLAPRDRGKSAGGS